MLEKYSTSAEEDAGSRLDSSASLRERKHEFVRREIERAAWDLFCTAGFDGTTIEAISRDAGVSRRTFFRYFASKEELLSTSIRDFGQRIVLRLAEAPHRGSPIAMMERAFLTIVREEMGEKLPQDKMTFMFEEPHLRGRFLFALSLWVPPLGEQLVRLKAYRGDPARCDLAAALYCTAFDHAHRQWLRNPQSSLELHLKRAFRQIHDLC